MKGKIAASVDEYIAAFPKDVQQLLHQIRKNIKATAPKVEEGIFYAMPGYKYMGKPLVYFAGYENHIGFYGTPAAHENFKKELAVYKSGKGSVQFPIDKPLPLKLITQIVKFRVKQNEERTAAKKETKNNQLKK